MNDNPAAIGTIYAAAELIPPVDNVTCPGPGGTLTLVSNVALPIPSDPVPGPAPAALWLLSVVLALRAGVCGADGVTSRSGPPDRPRRRCGPRARRPD